MNRIKTVNQYFMYGISVPYDAYKDWDLNGDKENISCLFDSRDGKYLIIGRILEHTTNEDAIPLLGYKEPLVVPVLGNTDELIIQNSVGKQFGVAGEFHYFFITHTR